MKRLISFSMLLLLAIALLSACRESRSGLITGTGHVYRSSGECTGWFIHSDAGREYELLDLAPEFQKNQLRVRFALKVRSDAVSVCMRGDIVDVMAIRRL